MDRHEIPTHLEVADRAFLGLTMRQLLLAAIGLALAYGALSDLPVPIGVRVASAALVLVAVAVLVLWRPHGRAAEEWAFVLLRFWTAPRIAVWRPQPAEHGTPEIREIVLPAAPSRVVTRDGDAHVA